jgi:hypothetical protein
MNRKPRIAAVASVKFCPVHQTCMIDRLRRQAGRQNSTAKE